jgi:methyl-accepting chemotaxis protein
MVGTFEDSENTSCAMKARWRKADIDSSLRLISPMSIKANFRLIAALAGLGLVTIAGSWLRSEYSRLLQEKQEKARNLIDIPYSVITEQYRMEQAGLVSREQAQQRALTILRTMRYAGENYFWVNDDHVRMVMHPIKPELEGKLLADYKDARGKLMFVEIVEDVQRHGEGFIAYMWTRPGSDKPVPKLSFVKGFAPWGWIVGTGFYVDDLQTAWLHSAEQAGVITLLCLAALLTICTRVSRSIVRRLRDVVERIRDVAEGEGDLTKRIALHSHDELAELAQWFNSFMDQLQNIIARVAVTSERLSTAGGDLSVAAGKQAHGAEEQRDQTTQVASAMQAMASSIQQISENSTQAANASQNAADNAREGGRIVQETLARMRSIADAVGRTAGQIQELGKRSDEIGAIIGVIDDIADQTNLLALNAAIEAARAGQQGRGFAVVADEVRKLAERTSAATREITSMIEGVQKETRSTVTAMQDGMKQVNEGVNSTTRAGDSLQVIIQMSDDVGNMITQIAAAATEQSATNTEINRNVDEIARITATSAAAARESTRTFEEFSGLTTNLRQLVGQFRLEPDS